VGFPSPCVPDRVGSICRNGRGRYRLGVGVIRGVPFGAVAQCEIFRGGSNGVCEMDMAWGIEMDGTDGYWS
jgi:hypothetical protein